MSKKEKDVMGGPVTLKEAKNVLDNMTNSMLEWKERCESQSKEVLRLKSVIGGYRTSNTNYAKKIDELKSQLETEKNRVGVLYGENKDLKKKVEYLTDELTTLTVDRDKYKAMYDDYISLSWWQRLFL